MRYVIIGNSAAGIFAAEEIRRLDREGQIEIISDETYPAYARCLTSYYLSGGISDEKMFIRPADFYARNNLTLHNGEKVVRIDPAEKKVVSGKGQSYDYDKLLIATGSSPFMPDIPGIKTKGVFGLRTLEDAKNIREYAKPGRRAVVVEGSFVSVEAAYALLKAGLTVSNIVSSGQILLTALDSEAASLVANKLTSEGLEIKYFTDVSEIVEKGGEVAGVKLTTGEFLPADVVVIGKGTIPNTGFLQGSGIVVDNGIAVDEYLQSNVPDIYAAGDVAQGNDIVLGVKRINAIWPNAAEQGAAAGKTMAGLKVKYDGSIGMNSIDFFGLSTISAGQGKAEGDSYEVVKLFPGQGQYLRLVFKEDKLAGYILVGQTHRAGILTELIRGQIPLGKLKEELTQGQIRQRILS